MQKKYWIALTLAIAGLASMLVSGKPTPPVTAPDTICCEVKSRGCDQKDSQPGRLLLDGMSRQFIVISPLAP
jgi:hypothetical protein